MVLLPEVEVLVPTLESIPIAVMITDGSGVVRFVNAQFLRLTGYAAEEIVGQDSGVLESEDVTPRLHNVLHHVFADGETWTGESDGRGRDGKRFEIALTITPIRDRLGSVTHALWTLQSITAHRRTEEALRESEEQYHRLFTSASDAQLLIATDTGQVLNANDLASALYGYSREELLAKNGSDLSAEPEETLRRIHESVRTPDQLIRIPLRLHRKKDGTVFPVEITARSFSMKGQGVLLVSSRDITERKRAEEELRATQSNYRLLIEQAEDGIFLTDSDGRFLVVNSGICKMLGYTAEEMRNLNVLDTYLPDELHLGRHRLSLIQRGHSVRIERSIRRKDGTTLPVESSARRLEDGKLQAIVRNIAERKQAEENYRTLFREMLDGFALHEILCDVEGRPTDYRFLTVNPAFERITGLKAEDILGKTVLEVLPGTEQYWIETFGKVALTGEPAFFENYHAGLSKHFDVTAYCPAPNQFACIFADITGRKRTEAALRESEGRLQYLISSSPVVIYTCETAGDYAVTFVSRNIEAQFGYKPQAFVDDPRFWAEHIHPEDAPKVAVELSRLFQRGRHSHDYRFLHQDGTYRWVRDEAVLTCNSEGRALEIVGSWADITESKSVEERLRKANQRLELAQAAAKAGAWDWMVGSGHLDWSSELFTLFGLDAGTTAASFEAWESAMHPEDREVAHLRLRRALEGHSDLENEYRVVLPDGRVRWISALGQATYDDQGRPLRMSGICVDITDRKEAEKERAKLQSQLQQSQKMESIGRLAGGIAHDFNNLLTVINGHSEMILARLSEVDPLRVNIAEINKAGERAARLTRQLLAYSRKQVLQPSTFSINRVVEEMLPMLRRLMGEDVDVHIALDSGAGMAHADPHQLEQVVMNLAVNSRDAMPGGGKLLIETANVELDDDFVQAHPGAQLGRFVTLGVSDTGVGMDAETRRNIFEPFFTTKGVGKGTGLGLSMVYGIVKQSGGYISVHSEPGHGTSFKIYLPQVEESHTVADVPVVAPPLGGTETVLVVEDQPEVLNFADIALSAFGYRVVKAESVREALRVFEQERGCIDLVLTDVMMPDRSGRELADELENLQRGIKVLFMSGYTDDTIAQHGVLEEGAVFIQKPFSPQQLATKVRMVLGQ